MAASGIIFSSGASRARLRRSGAASVEEGEMIVRYAISSAGMTLLLIAAPAHAGPCTDRIYQTDIAIEKLLDAAAAQGQPAAESTFATMHRQPTPRSVAGAEEKAGDLTPAQTQTIMDTMELARKADDAGDQAGCEKALGEAQSILNR
jgi:hypothetical protein